MIEDTCMHCLEESERTREWKGDACPSCVAKGHAVEWSVNGCEACNAEYYAEMGVVIANMHARIAREHPDG